jgi:hypothetical protein
MVMGKTHIVLRKNVLVTNCYLATSPNAFDPAASGADNSFRLYRILEKIPAPSIIQNHRCDSVAVKMLPHGRAAGKYQNDSCTVRSMISC